jgi:GNAT superfamily N-acetyltransferase
MVTLPAMPFIEAASDLSAAAGTIRLSPPGNSRTTVPFFQTIELLEGESVIASATWFTTGTDGVIQMLDIRVEASHRRRRVGTRLFKVLTKEAALFFKQRGGKLRRVICNAEQKSHIVARAFLTHVGFHHVQTIGNTLKQEDILVYLLGCD